MPQTTKTSISNTTTGVKKLKIALSDETGINEPHWDPAAPSFFRYKGKWYTKDKYGEIIRHYPPDEKQPHSKIKSKI